MATYHDAVAQRENKISWEKLPWAAQIVVSIVAAPVVAAVFAVFALGIAIFLGAA